MLQADPPYGNVNVSSKVIRLSKLSPNRNVYGDAIVGLEGSNSIGVVKQSTALTVKAAVTGVLVAESVIDCHTFIVTKMSPLG